MRRLTVVAALVATSSTALLAVACGGGEDGEKTATGATAGVDLRAVKDYLTEHTADLTEQVAALRRNAEAYHRLADSVEFDYRRLVEDHGAQVERLLADSKRAYVRANPAYEEMEGIVAGVPRLAQYDVDIDAGSDASNPESAVSFSLELPDGETLKQPGNLFFVTETALYGTNPDFLAKGVKQDVDRDGKVEFGEGLPDADIFVAALREFDRSGDLPRRRRAGASTPTPSDAFTALVIMTPTMSEYFETWKNTRFVAGEKATETAFVAASRLSDIADILEGLVFTYDEVEPLVARGVATAGRADRSRPGRAARVRRGAPRHGGLRAPVHGGGGRHARRRGTAPGGGDRGPGDAGRQAARDRAPGGVGMASGR